MSFSNIYQIGEGAFVCTNSFGLMNILKYLNKIINSMESDICTITGLDREEVVRNYKYLNSTNIFDEIIGTQDEKINTVLLAHEINKKRNQGVY